MTARSPLSPAPGLTRTAVVPPPPPRKGTHASTPSPEPATPATEESVQQSPVLPVVRPRGHGRRPRRTSGSSEPVRPISLSLPASLLARFKQRARAEQVAHADLLLDAITATADQLTVLLEGSQTVRDGLFVRRVPHDHHEVLATLSLRMLSSNVDAIDELVRTTRASSRSALVAAALRAYLQA